ncbi:MAG: hypothetical protein UZ14_CFX002000528 [Chloroflexi bacterium OLB14]|nr:MAG: hypothetical protein UZ14_CFX002000528 [Chloroflexi bacterium OLB14]
MPQKAKHLKTIGDELDLAVKYKRWYPNRNEYLKITEVSQIKQQLNTPVNEFSWIFPKEEAERWLSDLLTFVINFPAYDIGVEALSHYIVIISDDKSRQILVKKIVNEIFLPQKEKDLFKLTDFIIHITEYGIKTNQPLLIRFCEEILQYCLNSKQYKKALYLWSKLIQLEWASSTGHFVSALAQLSQIQGKDDFLYIVNIIGCPPNKQAFMALLSLLKRLSKLPTDIPQNFKFLDSVNDDVPKKYLEFLPKCFAELQSYKWLGSQIKFGYENVDGFYQEIPLLIEKIGLETANKFFENVRDERDDLLTAITAFSIILNQIQKGDTKPKFLNNYLSSIEMCQPQYIDEGIEILMKHWMFFSVQQLETMLNFVETKPKLRNINRISEEIRTNIQKKNRIKRVEDTFTSKIKKENLGHIIFDFTYEFSRFVDIEAWMLFEGHIRNRRYLNEYHNYLIQILLENRFYKIEDYKLKDLYFSLDNAGLHYEADVFAYWLLFHRGIFINPFDTIYRTLSLSNLSYIRPNHAGMLIGQKKAFDSKLIRSIAARIVEMSPKEAESLIEKLDVYMGKYVTSTFGNRLRTLVTDLPPDIIWLEICKALSKQLKSEIKKY